MKIIIFFNHYFINFLLLESSESSDSEESEDSVSDVSRNGTCITSCTGLPNGDYQSCLGCHVYASCSNGVMYDGRPCPAGLVWDDNVKRCEWTSTTCGSEHGRAVSNL